VRGIGNDDQRSSGARRGKTTPEKNNLMAFSHNKKEKIL
jgi:hypothetical protein